MRILLVEDEPTLGELVAAGLRQEAYAVDLVGTSSDAVAAVATTTYDVACVDVGLPDGDGIDLVARFVADRDRRPRRTIILTAHDAVEHRVRGLDAGADDYLTKPFDLAELSARIRALSRRTDQKGAQLRAGGLRIDLATHRTTRCGSEIELTAREFALLRFFMSHPDEVLSAEHLLEHVWDSNADPFTASVRVIVSRLRKKLGDPTPIETLAGSGYRLRDGRCD
jgi:DNA-binding response OmpR family regulator